MERGRPRTETAPSERQTGPLTVIRGLPEDLHREAAAVMYRPFRSKLGRLLQENGDLVGVPGLKTSSWSFFKPTVRTALDVYRLLHGPLVLFVLTPTQERPQPGEPVMDQLAVRPDACKEGVGSLVSAAADDAAREEGYEFVRLSVVDTNAAAQRLYERAGFVAGRTFALRIPRS